MFFSLLLIVIYYYDLSFWAAKLLISFELRKFFGKNSSFVIHNSPLFPPLSLPDGTFHLASL